MEKVSDAWDDGGRTSLEADSLQLRPLIGTVTSFDGSEGYINQTTCFARHSLLEGILALFHIAKFVGPTSGPHKALIPSLFHSIHLF